MQNYLENWKSLLKQEIELDVVAKKKGHYSRGYKKSTSKLTPSSSHTESINGDRT